MSRWYPDVLTLNEAKDTARTGAYCALGFAVMAGLGLAFETFTGHMPGQPPTADPAGKVGEYSGMIIELALILFGAWRFWIYRGAFYGIVLLLLFVVELYLKITSGTLNAGWALVWAVVGMGMFNGMRAAWAFRSVAKGDTEWLEPIDAE